MFKRPICNYDGELKEVSHDDRVIGFPVLSVNSNTTAISNTIYAVNTTSSPITLTLPTAASAGDRISITDYNNTFHTNNLTIDRNGHKIEGLGEDLIIDVSGFSFTLVYVDTTIGWKRIV